MNDNTYNIATVGLLCIIAIILTTWGHHTVTNTFKPDPTVFQTMKASCDGNTKIVKYTDDGMNITLDCETGLITYFRKI